MKSAPNFMVLADTPDDKSNLTQEEIAVLVDKFSFILRACLNAWETNYDLMAHATRVCDFGLVDEWRFRTLSCMTIEIIGKLDPRIDTLGDPSLWGDVPELIRSLTAFEERAMSAAA